MISIYTRTSNIFSKEYIKWFLKRIINKRGGPESVLDSLERCLKIQKVPYEINPRNPKYKTLHVLSGIGALQDAIKMKQQHKIDKIVAGPNLVITPDEHNKILFDSSIDVILLPSQWTVDLYKKYLPQEQSQKIEIWPASVLIPEQEMIRTKKETVLLFIKMVDEKLAEKIKNFLKERGLPFETIQYGKYKQSEYFSLLEKSKFMIYLQIVESQGLALQEAWARNVPTLVLEKNSFTYKDGKIAYGQVSAPYLNKNNGLFFKDFEDFKIRFEELNKDIALYSPRKYCIENLSDEVISEKYVSIISKLI